MTQIELPVPFNRDNTTPPARDQGRGLPRCPRSQCLEFAVLSGKLRWNGSHRPSVPAMQRARQ